MTPPSETGPLENWAVRKAPVRSAKGVVAAQNVRAAEVGAEVLRAGGNAIDAAVATVMALGVVEPWMSGIGGGGYMMVYLAAERRVQAIDFAMVAPAGLDPAAYPLAGGGQDADLFGWPDVVEARNVHGPLSIAVPGAVAGLSLALERYGSLPWAEVLAPAIAMARQGHPVDWWTTLKVAEEASALRLNSGADVYLPDGLPPVAGIGQDYRLDLGALADTLTRLAEAGPDDYYRGDIAAALTADLRDTGSVLTTADLAAYRALLADHTSLPRNGAEVHVLKGLNAGPTFAKALATLPDLPSGDPGPAAYAAYAKALSDANAIRFETLGHDGDNAGQACTTHLSVIDGAGNMVTLTNTLLSLFGSKVVSPQTGVLMNNGIMWFDPRPGRANSIAPGQRPLCNMCPVVVTRQGAPWFALGASGGRRIMPAAFQVTSFLVDCGLDLDTAVHAARLNVDGGPAVELDMRLDAAVAEAVAAEGLPVVRVEERVSPNPFANPQIVLHDGQTCWGSARVKAPFAAAVGA